MQAQYSQPRSVDTLHNLANLLQRGALPPLRRFDGSAGEPTTDNNGPGSVLVDSGAAPTVAGVPDHIASASNLLRRGAREQNRRHRETQVIIGNLQEVLFRERPTEESRPLPRQTNQIPMLASNPHMLQRPYASAFADTSLNVEGSQYTITMNQIDHINAINLTRARNTYPDRQHLVQQVMQSL